MLNIRIWKLIFVIIIIVTSALTNCLAQEKNENVKRWSFQTNILLSGSSDESEPDGYIVYSALSIEPAIAYGFGNSVSMLLKFRTESHEVDYEIHPDVELPIGSIELIPLNLLIKYSFLHSKFQPFIAGGINSTFCWEKSGFLNSSDLTTGFGPSLSLGTDYIVNSSLFFNLNIGWNALKMDIKDSHNYIASLKMDPLMISGGIGFNF